MKINDKVLYEKTKSKNKNKNKNKNKDKHPPLKGFFKAGENYVPLLNRKSKILSRILEETDK